MRFFIFCCEKLILEPGNHEIGDIIKFSRGRVKPRSDSDLATQNKVEFFGSV